jgi:hypothetical protein
MARVAQRDAPNSGASPRYIPCTRSSSALWGASTGPRALHGSARHAPPSRRGAAWAPPNCADALCSPTHPLAPPQPRPVPHLPTPPSLPLGPPRSPVCAPPCFSPLLLPPCSALHPTPPADLLTPWLMLMTHGVFQHQLRGTGLNRKVSEPDAPWGGSCPYKCHHLVKPLCLYNLQKLLLPKCPAIV